MINSVNAYNAEFYNVDIYVSLCCKKTKKNYRHFTKRKLKFCGKVAIFVFI